MSGRCAGQARDGWHGGAAPRPPEEPEGWDVQDFDQPPVELGLASAILLLLVLLSPLF